MAHVNLPAAPDADSLTISSPVQYIRAFEQGAAAAASTPLSPPLQVLHLNGRFIRGIKDSDFERLSDEENKRLVFIAGAGGLQE